MIDKQKEEQKVMLTMRLPLSLRQRFVDIVNNNGQKQNFVLVKMVKQYVEEHEQKH